MFDVVTGRRNFARILGGMAGVVVVGGSAAAGVKAVQKNLDDERTKFRTLPWPYAKLDLDRVAMRAFDGYKKAGCMYGVFEPMVGATAERLGPTYQSFPHEMMAFGTEGIAGWATVCGALSGAAAAFHMLSKEPGPLVDALFGWYQEQPLPNVQLASMKPVTQTVAGSPLCHVSIAHWCQSTGKKAQDPARIERCAAIVASVARRATELLNTQFAGRPLPVVQGQAATCGACHEKGGTIEDVVGKLDCQGCHFHLTADAHPKT